MFLFLLDPSVKNKYILFNDTKNVSRFILRFQVCGSNRTVYSNILPFGLSIHPKMQRGNLHERDIRKTWRRVNGTQSRRTKKRSG